MEKPSIFLNDQNTNENFIREMTDQEYSAFLADKNSWSSLLPENVTLVRIM